jgi:phosphatidylglycerol:prolipoprotein diacylglycerol transferase
VLYSTARFVIEFFRVHEQSLVGPFSLTQWIALGLLALGAVILIGPGLKTRPAAQSAA